jgi:hypothetical protein
MGVDAAWEQVMADKGLIPARPVGSALAAATRPATAGKPTVRPAPPPPPVVVIDVTVPGVRLVSEANAGGRRKDAIARKLAVKDAVRNALPRLADPLPLPAAVTITRIGTRKLDEHDNLGRSVKAVVDVVSQWLAVDDADPRVTWAVRQEPGYGPAVRIRVRTTGGDR